MNSHYILHWNPGSVSMLVHWALKLLEPRGVTFELRRCNIWEGQQKSEEYLRLNPLGQVPVLVYDGDQSITETIAILLFLAERHPSSHLCPPTDSPLRAKYLQTMVLVANSMMSALRNYAYADRDGDPEGAKWVKAMAEKRMALAFGVVDHQLEGGRYLFGEDVSMADLAIVCNARWARRASKSPMEWSNIRRLVEDMGRSKEYQEVCKAEDITAWPTPDE